MGREVDDCVGDQSQARQQETERHAFAPYFSLREFPGSWLRNYFRMADHAPRESTGHERAARYASSVQHPFCRRSHSACSGVAKQRVTTSALGCRSKHFRVVLLVDLHQLGEELGTAVREMTSGRFDIGEESLEPRGIS